jgi:hypothetical protein
MIAAAPQAERTVVVMLGGSIYPHCNAFNNLRFKCSAEGLRDYFLDPKAFNLPQQNLLWLFDDTCEPTELNDRVDTFLRIATERPEAQRPLDVIIVFIGHGFFDDRRSYYLATSSYRAIAPEYSYSFRFLQRTVKNRMRFARKFYLLDACFSASAVRELMSPATEGVFKEIKEEASDNLPKHGTAALCAASKDDQAIAPNTEEQTMFCGALLSVLGDTKNPGSVLSLRQLHASVVNVIQSQFPETGVRPEIHAPDQKDGDVSTIPLFPLSSAPSGRDFGVRDAFDDKTFVDEALLHTVVVCRSSLNPDQLPPLLQVVSDAWNNFSDSIIVAANACRASWGAPPIPVDSKDGSHLLAHLAVEQAFESEPRLRSAVIALCRAEIAVFDLTDWDEGATFLLGVRAVARRGVTITSVGGDFTIGGELLVPFNLQLLNLAAHSDAQENKSAGDRPFELIGSKMINGFRDLANLPHYLDLPAYDSVRQLGVESGAYRPVQPRERVLVLCPFSQEYTRRNFRRLEKMLPSRVQNYVAQAEARPAEKPPLVRLLDLKTPRLVVQTLFESIRLTDMCVVDWTEMRTNVIFEAGVRMATNPLGAIHVIEHKSHQNLRKLGHDRRQILEILNLFKPLDYPLGGTDIDPFDAMLQRFMESIDASQRGEANLIYSTVGTALDRRSQPAALPLVNELIRSANLLDPDDQESIGISPVLYHQINPELATEAREAAAERRLAAWLFLSRRYSAVEIANETLLLDQFSLLSTQVRRWARRAGRKDILEEISTRFQAVKESGAQGDDR